MEWPQLHSMSETRDMLFRQELAQLRQTIVEVKREKLSARKVSAGSYAFAKCFVNAIRSFGPRQREIVVLNSVTGMRSGKPRKRLR